MEETKVRWRFWFTFLELFCPTNFLVACDRVFGHALDRFKQWKGDGWAIRLFFPSHFEIEGIYAIVFAMKGTNTAHLAVLTFVSTYKNWCKCSKIPTISKYCCTYKKILLHLQNVSAARFCKQAKILHREHTRWLSNLFLTVKFEFVIILRHLVVKKGS